jgi:hypothetical protein
MEHAKNSRRPSSRALTLMIPTRLMCDVIRLAELMGTPLQVELAVNLSTALEHLAEPGGAEAVKAVARRLPAEPEAWETVRLWLPSAQGDRLREVARSLKLAQGKALSAMLAPVVDDQVQIATYAVEHQVSFAEARRAFGGAGGEAVGRRAA